MELKCAVVFTLASWLSVTATPHGYGSKGGAVARAEAGAATGAFGAVGLPLSIQSGPGFSGSFSKSSSSSFASSSASSSAGSFSFSGSGASGFGLNNLGTAGTGGCSGGCQGDSKGTNDSNGSGSAGYGLQAISGAKADAVAGAAAGSFIKSKDGEQSPCSSGECPGKKSECDGPNCKDANGACTSGQCAPSSETSSPDSDQNDCGSGKCNTNFNSGKIDSPNCENGKCSGNSKNPSSSYENNNCANGQCALPPSTSDFETNVACTSGECTKEPSTKPERDYGSNDIPVSITTSSSFANGSSHLSESHNTGATTSQTSAANNCKNGNCDSLPPNTKPSYGYSNRPTASNGDVTPTKPATHLTAPKEDEPCNSPNCKPRPSTHFEDTKPTSSNFPPGKTNCEGGYCENGQTHKYPLPINNYSNNGASQPKNPSYVQGSPDQGGNNVFSSSNCASGSCENPSNSIPLFPKTPDYSQSYSPSSSDNCATGNCGSQPSYHYSPDIQVSKYPSQPHASDYAPNCPSGNCSNSPKQHIGSSIPSKVPSYPYNPTPNENCPSGNCGNSFTLQPKIPYSNSPNNCASGNCGTYPSYQNSFDIQVSKASTQSPVTDLSSNPFYPTNGNTVGYKNPVSSLPPSFASPSNCAYGNCQPYFESKPLVPGYSKGPSLFGQSNCESGSCSSGHNSDSSYPRLPSYPQNILPSKPLECSSGNCANYPSAGTHTSASPIGSKFPLHPPSPVSGPASCASGNCGNNPTYQQGSFGTSSYHSPSYSGSVPTCTSGNCGINPLTPAISGPQIPSLSTGSSPSTSFTSSKPLPTGPISSSSNCASGKCPSNSGTQPSSQPKQPLSSSSPNTVPNFVALGVAGGTFNTGSNVPTPISSSQHSGSASQPTSNSGIVTGAHSQSSISSNYNDKEQVYTGGFGGPPGILKPYEFTAPSPSLPSGNKVQGQLQCSNGKCNAQSEGDSNKKYDLSSGPTPCSSGKCETQPGKPNDVQSKPLACSSGNCANYPSAGAQSGASASNPKIPLPAPPVNGPANCASGNCGNSHTYQQGSGAFAAAAAGSEGIIYTGGFGGPPGILKPYDGGKIGNFLGATILGAKHHAGAGSNNDASNNKLNGVFGAFSGAAATANAGSFGSESHEDHNKAGGCNTGCGSSGPGGYGGHFGAGGGLLKSDLLEKLHNGALRVGQSAAGAISGAGASSFAVGGSFAGSAASAHSVAGSSVKGGYGR